MSRYISGRYKKTPQSGLTSDRYRYLSPGDAEPNLGDPPTVQGTPNLPTGQQYIVISFLDRPGERFWIPNQGGIIPGSISVFDENSLVGGLSSTTQLNFEGNAIVAEGFGTGTNNPGVAVTVTVAPPGDNNSVLFKNNDDFATDSRFIFNDGLFTAGDRITVGTGGTVITTTLGGLVGIGTTNPTQKLHLDGNFRITGTIYDSTNQPGTQGDLIVKGENGGLLWVNPSSVQAGAGGTVGQIQFHNTAGLVDGAENFYFDFNNNRVGIGSTIPTQLLDVLGVSTFSGGVNIDTLTVTQNSTFEKNLDVEGNLTVDGKLEVDGLSDLDELNVVGIATFDNNIDAKKDLDITGQLDVDGHTELDNLGVSGIATFSSELQIDDTGNLNVLGPSVGVAVTLAANAGITTTGGDLYVGGDLYIKDDLTFDHLIANTGEFTQSLKVSGILTATTSADIGDLTITSNIIKPTAIGGTLVLQSSGGITTTSGDLYVGGDLYVEDDVIFDDITANEGTFNALFLGDDEKINFGDSPEGANDLQIYHTADLGQPEEQKGTAINLVGTGITVGNEGASIIEDTGEGPLIFKSNEGGSKNGAINFYDNVWRPLAKFRKGGNTEFFFQGSHRLITTLYGTEIYRDLVVLDQDNNTAKVGIGTANPTEALEVKGNAIPNLDLEYNLGSLTKRWNNVYANTFNGDFQGTADNADKLTTPRTFTLGEGEDDDIVSIGKTFDGSANVGFALTLTTTGVEQGSYGSSTQVGIVTVDTKGRVTSASNVDINFAGASVDIANKLKTPRTFTLGEGTDDDIVSIGKTFDGSANVGFALTLKNVGPGAGTYGGDNKLISLALDDKGRVTGVTSTSIDFGIANVATADSLTDSRNIAATGDIAWNVDFKGHEDVTAAASLATIVTGSTVGSSTQVGVVTFDAKGRITAASNVDIDFGNATVDKASYADNAGIATNLKGGQAYQIPYQSAADTTQFIPNGTITGQLLQYNESSAPSWVSVADLTAGIANSLSGGAAGSIPYQSGTDTTVFLGEPDADNRVLTYNNTTNAPEWKELGTIDGAGYTIEAADDGDNAKIILTDGGTGISSITVTAGSNITIDPADSSGFTIAAVAGAGLGVAASADDILNVTSGNIEADDAGGDKIVFYDDSEEKLTYLNVGTGLTITDSTITANEDAGKTYDLTVEQTSGTDDDPAIRLSDGTTNDDITITGGSNITVTRNSNTELTIDAVAGAGVGIAVSASDVLKVDAGQIDAVDAGGEDKIVFYDESEEKLTYLTVGTGLTITNTEISASGDVGNTTYDLETQANGDNIELKLVGSDNTTGIVTITAGTDITLTDNGDGFTIDSTSGSGTLTDIDVKLYSDNNTPRTEYACTNPIDVDISVGVATIGIGTVSNAYGKRYIGPDEPTGGDICDGDIWYDTSSGGGSDSFSQDPVGTIVAWSGSIANIPDGYQLCDGSTAQTLSLQEIVGTNVPDLRDRFIIGAGNNYAVDATGGSANAVVAAHTHSHNISINNAQPFAYRVTSGANDEIGTAGVNINYITPSITGGIQSGGLDADGNASTDQSGTNANLPPYYALAYIIKHSSVSVTLNVSAGDKIEEGNSKAEIIDTASESKFTVKIDAAEKFSVDDGGPKIHRQDSSIEGGSIVFNRAADDVAAFELDVYGSSSSDSGRFRIVDSTSDEERFAIGPNGEIGLGGANYGTSGQVLTSGGPGAGVTWADAISASAPSSASSTGTAGTIAYDTNYIYVCVAANTWKRVSLSTW
jgi:cytoskeletal protein CcmA (bactofilin family)